MENHYFDENGYYTHSSPANAGSIEPSNATRVDLPNCNNNEVRKFNTESELWEIHPNLVGTKYYNQDGTIGEITEVGGVLPAGTLVDDPPDETYLSHDGTVWIQDEIARKAKFREDGKAKRDAWIEDAISAFGVVWQVDERSRELMGKAIFVYEYHLKAGTPIPNAQPWILDDNSVRMTTYEELQAILVKHAMRTSEAYGQFNTWSAAGMTAPFEIDYTNYPNVGAE